MSVSGVEAIHWTRRGANAVGCLCLLQWALALNQHLNASDPELFDIIEKEKQRQRNCISLIASENFTSASVLDALGSVMSNKYSEGYPGQRYAPPPYPICHDGLAI